MSPFVRVSVSHQRAQMLGVWQGCAPKAGGAQSWLMVDLKQVEFLGVFRCFRCRGLLVLHSNRGVPVADSCVLSSVWKPFETQVYQHVGSHVGYSTAKINQERSQQQWLPDVNTAFGPLLNPSSPSSWVTDIYSNCPPQEATFVHKLDSCQRKASVFVARCSRCSRCGRPTFSHAVWIFWTCSSRGLEALTVLRPVAYGHLAGTAATLALLRPLRRASDQQLLLHCAAAGCPVLGDRRGFQWWVRGQNKRLAKMISPYVYLFVLAPPKRNKQTCLVASNLHLKHVAPPGKRKDGC